MKADNPSSQGIPFAGKMMIKSLKDVDSNPTKLNKGSYCKKSRMLQKMAGKMEVLMFLPFDKKKNKICLYS